MRSETLPPIGKVDPGLRDVPIRLDLLKVPEMAREVEDLGYDGMTGVVPLALIRHAKTMAAP